MSSVSCVVFGVSSGGLGVHSGILVPEVGLGFVLAGIGILSWLNCQ